MSTVEESRLNELKFLCVEDESAEAHASHAADLEAAYAAFQGRTQGSNPAPADAVTELSAELVVASDMPTQLPPDAD